MFEIFTYFIIMKRVQERLDSAPMQIVRFVGHPEQGQDSMILMGPPNSACSMIFLIYFYFLIFFFITSLKLTNLPPEVDTVSYNSSLKSQFFKHSITCVSFPLLPTSPYFKPTLQCIFMLQH